MTDLELIKELSGDTCRCGRPKTKSHTFCGGCYHSLPPAQQKALYSRPGQGYREAYEAACVFLDASPAFKGVR